MAVSAKHALWEEIAAEIRRQIQRGELRPGDVLPSEEELSNRHRVSRGTVRNALNRLVTEGLINEGQGRRGRTVRSTRRLNWDLARYEGGDRLDTSADDNWSIAVRNAGMEPRRDVDIRHEIAPAEVAEWLQLPPGDRVVSLRDRLNCADDRPYQWAISYFPLDVAEGTVLEEAGNQNRPGGLLAHAGVPQRLIKDTIRVRMPTPEEALKLELPPATPVFEHIRIGITDNDRPIRVMVTIAPGDRWELNYDLPITRPVYHIRRAQISDIGRIIDLRAEGETWLKDAGIEQWTYADRARAKIRAAVKAGNTWVLSEQPGSAIIGSVTLQGPDMDFWTESDDPDAGLYVYTLVIARSHKGRDLGGVLLDFAGRQARKIGASYVRLDCWVDNTKLHHYYEMHEFTHLRTVRVENRMSGALFQRPADRYTRGDIQLIED